VHTKLNDPGLLIVFELVVSGNNAEGLRSEVSCGWGSCKLFQTNTKSIDLSDGSPAPAAR
jgi:hypothetical protein